MRGVEYLKEQWRGYDFKEDLLQKNSKEVIECAYELVCKQEITDYFHE